MLYEVITLDGKKQFRHLVDHCDASRPVDDDDPGGEVRQDRLDEPASPSEFLERGREGYVGVLEALLHVLEVRRHPVEGADQVPEFVVGSVVKPDVEVSGSHLLGPLRQHLDGDGDLPRQIDSHPGGGKHHEQGNEDKRSDVARITSYNVCYTKLLRWIQPLL